MKKDFDLDKEYCSQPPIERPKFRRDHEASSKAMLDTLYDWMLDLQKWGERVRNDIVRLEGQHPGLAEGDPGPPPPPPWKPD